MMKKQGIRERKEKEMKTQRELVDKDTALCKIEWCTKRLITLMCDIGRDANCIEKTVIKEVDDIIEELKVLRKEYTDRMK